jgi:hypothetical protein
LVIVICLIFVICDLEFLVALLPILIMIFVHFVLFVVRLALR